MPAFTFEKISPPVRSTTPPGPTGAQTLSSQHESKTKHRGIIVQMLDRLVVARMKREQRSAETSLSYKRPPPD